ncbi:hypothetical protein [Agarilytica rhodophyticola]|uniref:hypothetical protein n=1 Tax=Agarilytica rhodophyticola TaxID=1737490 RepID=UPI000B34332A|nr:hypothetical protein [Agarilytica rhodophyticola]
MRDSEESYKEVKIPASETYIIEGISTPHLIDSDEHVFVQVNVDYDTSVSRRADRNHDEDIPESVRLAEDNAQFYAVLTSHNVLKRNSINPDIQLDSTEQTPGSFRQIA